MSSPLQPGPDGTISGTVTKKDLVSEKLSSLTRKPDREADRDMLNQLCDEQKVGVLSTVIDGQPWSIPTLYARDEDRLLLHGSSGAGLFRHIADGAPVTFTIFALDALVVSDTLHNHSANYRSVVVRGTCTVVSGTEELYTLSDALIPGRSAETPAITAKEHAATLTLELPLQDWIAKARSGPPGIDTDVWTGLVPVNTSYGQPITATGTNIPPSVQKLSEPGE